MATPGATSFAASFGQREQLPLHSVVPRYQQAFTTGSGEDGPLSAHRRSLTTAVSPLVASSPLQPMIRPSPGPSATPPATAASAERSPGLSITVPLDKYEQLLAHLSKKQREQEVLRQAVLKEREERRKAESTVQSVQSALEDREEELRVYVEEVQRLSFTQETLTKKVAALQRDLQDAKDADGGAGSTVLGSLLSSANWERKEVESLSLKLDTISRELDQKIEENEQLHIGLFDSRQALERQSNDFAALRTKLEKKAEEALALVQSKEEGYSVLATKVEELERQYEQTKQELVAAQNQALFAKQQLVSLNGSLKATIATLKDKLALALPLDSSSFHPLHLALANAANTSSATANAAAAGQEDAQRARKLLASALPALARLGPSAALWREAVAKKRMARLALPLLSSSTSPHSHSAKTDEGAPEPAANGSNSKKGKSLLLRDATGADSRAIASLASVDSSPQYQALVARLHACDGAVEERLVKVEGAFKRALGLLSRVSAILEHGGSGRSTRRRGRKVVTKLPSAEEEEEEENEEKQAKAKDQSEQEEQSSSLTLPSWFLGLVESVILPIVSSAVSIQTLSAFRDVFSAEGERIAAFSALLQREAEEAAKAAVITSDEEKLEEDGGYQQQALRVKRSKELKALHAASVACSELFAKKATASLSALEQELRKSFPSSSSDRKEQDARQKILDAALTAVSASGLRSGSGNEKSLRTTDVDTRALLERAVRSESPAGCESFLLQALLGTTAAGSTGLGIAAAFPSLFPSSSSASAAAEGSNTDEREETRKDGAAGTAAFPFESLSPSPAFLQLLQEASASLAAAQSRCDRLREAASVLSANEPSLALLRLSPPPSSSSASSSSSANKSGSSSSNSNSIAVLNAAFARADEGAAAAQRSCLAGVLLGELVPVLSISFSRKARTEGTSAAMQASLQSSSSSSRQAIANAAANSSANAPSAAPVSFSSFVSLSDAIAAARDTEARERQLEAQRERERERQMLTIRDRDGLSEATATTHEGEEERGSEDGRWVKQLMKMELTQQGQGQERGRQTFDRDRDHDHDVALHHTLLSHSAAMRGGNEQGGETAAAVGFHTPFSLTATDDSQLASQELTSQDEEEGEEGGGQSTALVPAASSSSSSSSSSSRQALVAAALQSRRAVAGPPAVVESPPPSISALSLFPGLFSADGASLAVPLASFTRGDDAAASSSHPSGAASTARLPPRYPYSVAAAAVKGLSKAVAAKEQAKTKASELEILSEALEQQVVQLQKAHEEVSRSLATAQDRHNEELKQREEKHKEEVASLKQLTEKAQHDAHLWEKKCGVRMSELMALQKDLETKDKESAKLKDDAQRENRALLALAGRLEEEQSAAAALRLRLDEEVSSNQRLQAELETAKEVLVSEQRQRIMATDEAEAKARELGDELAALKQRIDDYESSGGAVGAIVLPGSPRAAPASSSSAALANAAVEFASPEPQALVLEEGPQKGRSRRGSSGGGGAADIGIDSGFYEEGEPSAALSAAEEADDAAAKKKGLKGKKKGGAASASATPSKGKGKGGDEESSALTELRSELQITKSSLAEQSQLCFTLKTQLQACQQSMALQNRLKEEAQAEANKLKELLTQRAQADDDAAAHRNDDGEKAAVPVPEASDNRITTTSEPAGVSVLVKMHKEEVSALKAEIERLTAKHDEEMNRIRRQARDRIASLQESHEGELSEVQKGHEELVRMLTESHQEQLQELSDSAAASANNLKRAEGELRELGSHSVRCGKAGCEHWMKLPEAVLADGRCARCHRLLECFR